MGVGGGGGGEIGGECADEARGQASVTKIEANSSFRIYMASLP